ncbi:lytic transglycosylase domain-containing protein [Terrabacter sp. MAHUQ-38]|uniref:lytic transglycosylase domain-containing protein n=1 Tax=unclassified Terrabacter TaxID=2630222 RepID=UPI002103766A|nr:lytic transglycosylase domain-containing protein [Terrabacter sp. MAHUQ-38]
MRRTERGAIAVMTAAVVAALVTVTTALPAHAGDDGSVPTPTPSPQLTFPPRRDPGAPATSLPAVTSGPGFGALAGELVSPLFDGIRVAAAYVVGVPVTEDAAQLEPGGGSSTRPHDWTPPADLRTPIAVAPRPGSSGGRAARTKEQILWAAYESAAASEAKGCRIPAMLLAAIGEVESSSLRGRSLDARHDVVPPVRGPALSGGSFAAIHDTDGGRFDGDPVWDRAVGPMQFIPGTWRLWGADANGDGVADPQNVEDATLAAARYLCAGGRDLTRPDDLRAAVRSYNHSDRYVRTVLGLVEAVTSGEQAGP